MISGQRQPQRAGSSAGSSNANGSWFLTALRDLISSISPNETRDEQDLKDKVFAAAVSEPVPDHNPIPNNFEIQPKFSKSPHDLTPWIKGKGLYPFDTSGASADVWKCVFVKPDTPSKTVAVKAFRSPGSDEKVVKKSVKKLREEVHVWVRLSHPNVLPLYGMVCGFAPLPALVSPWVEHGTLNKYLTGAGQGLSKGGRASLLVKVADALDYIHSEHVVHGDLTGSNILIDCDGEPLISDFGLSSIIREFRGNVSYFMSCKPGAWRWAAPELLGTNGSGPLPDPNPCTDIYSFGCVMLHVLSGQLPYFNVNDNFVLMLKARGELPERPTTLLIEQSAWGVITACLNTSDKQRPKLNEVIEFLRKELPPA